MSGQVSGLVAYDRSRWRLRVPPHPPPRSAGAVHEDPGKSSQIRCHSLHIGAITGTSDAKRARLGAKPGFSSVDAKWARGQRGGRVAAGLLPFPATACLETLKALISSRTKKFFAARSLSAGRSFGYGVG
jgi:hypothetical protein